MPIRIAPLLSPAALAIAAALTLVASAARAEDVQVPLERSGRIERIDVALARRLGIFVDRYPGFLEARLFRAADSTFTLEVTMRRDRRLTRERLPLSAAGADSLRDDISMRIAERAPESTLQQDGRALLLTGSTLLSLGFYGWALPVVVDVQDGQAFAGLYMLVVGGGFFLPFAITGEQDVTYGMTHLSLYGATRGIAHGVFLHEILSASDLDQGTLGTAVAVSLAEGLGGYLWARSARLDAGDAAAIGTIGDLGLLEGLGFATLNQSTGGDSEAEAAGAMLMGSAAGLVAGNLLARQRDFSYGDASIMRDAGFVGVFAADMITDWFDPKDDDAYVAAAMAGGLAGIAIGDRLVRKTEFTVGQSIMVSLGTVAGAALGLGVGYSTSGSSGQHDTYLLTASMLGSALGFAGTYWSLLPSARARVTDRSSWRMELSPLAAAAGSRAATGVPIVRVSCRF